MDLRKYLDANGIKYAFFAERIGISYVSLSKIFNGAEPRLSLAIKIEDETSGKVKVRDLVSKEKIEEQEPSKAKSATKTKKNKS